MPASPAVAPVSVAPAVAARGRTLPFDPARDGFHFPNRFRWQDDDLADLVGHVAPLASAGVAAAPALAGAAAGGRRGLAAGALVGAAAAGFAGAVVRGVAKRWPTFGLCGGMALAAAERWPHRAGLPTHALDPARIRPLLRRRQAETLRDAGARFLGYWLTIRFGPGDRLAAPLGAALRREVARARARIDAGRPVVLGLVGDAPDPFEMHQVVAFGYHELPGGATRFDVYDPNAPGARRHVTAAVRGRRTHVTTDLPTGHTNGRCRLSTVPGRLGMAFVVA